MMDERFPQRLRGTAFERWQNADAVLGGGDGQLLAKDLSAGGEEVVQADELIACAASLYVTWPTDEKRDAMATVEDVGLRPAKSRAGIVALHKKLIELRFRRTTVIAGENDQRVVGQSEPVERVQHDADTGVGLHDEVGVGIQPALALPLFRR